MFRYAVVGRCTVWPRGCGRSFAPFGLAGAVGHRAVGFTGVVGYITATVADCRTRAAARPIPVRERQGALTRLYADETPVTNQLRTMSVEEQRSTRRGTATTTFTRALRRLADA